jgi:hypothetical protein
MSLFFLLLLLLCLSAGGKEPHRSLYRASGVLRLVLQREIQLLVGLYYIIALARFKTSAPSLSPFQPPHNYLACIQLKGAIRRTHHPSAGCRGAAVRTALSIGLLASEGLIREPFYRLSVAPAVKGAATPRQRRPHKTENLQRKE